mmetsp:Transcript_35038/g.118685  ORF Transcript_35038/g.118685 Transcript_35038/m.118685 type:complete len:230 (+) Transcript_35038:32-721(+)
MTPSSPTVTSCLSSGENLRSRMAPLWPTTLARSLWPGAVSYNFRSFFVPPVATTSPELETATQDASSDWSSLRSTASRKFWSRRSQRVSRFSCPTVKTFVWSFDSAMELMPPMRCVWDVMRFSLRSSQQRKLRSREQLSAWRSSSYKAKPVTMDRCSLRWDTSSRLRSSQTRTSPSPPPVMMKRWLFARTKAETPPRCAWSMSQSGVDVSDSCARILPSDQPEMRKSRV